MCDTFVAMSDVTAQRNVIFGKNSDRPRGEIQDVIIVPSEHHPAGATVRCTYLRIPQVARTLAVVLSKPRWMWGAEMGCNERGVVIGNEAVWTTEPMRDTGLLGMDLVRLGLERGNDATEALEVIIQLAGEFGQGGNCAEHFAMNYHNSFLIADPVMAWVLETAGEYWVAERITSGTRSISNALSIRDKGDRRHPDLTGEFDFAQRFSMGDIDHSLTPDSREGRVRELCRMNEGRYDPETAKSILRDHQGGICMHGDFETRGSQVSALSEGKSRHWFIEVPFPCRATYREHTIPT